VRQVAAPVDDLYFPAVHAAHGPPFGPVDPALQVQLVKAALPAGALEFDGQARHTTEVEAPTDVEYVAAAQIEQVVAPANCVYFPATHPGQVVAPTAIECVPASQSEQLAFPFNVLYMPATHTVHGPPFGPVHPALQVQFVLTELPAGELAPPLERDGQSVQ
jgi:hypothetical protein